MQATGYTRKQDKSSSKTIHKKIAHDLKHSTLFFLKHGGCNVMTCKAASITGALVFIYDVSTNRSYRMKYDVHRAIRSLHLN